MQINAVSGVTGALLVLMFAGITGAVVRLNGQELLNTSYLPNPHLGREWRSTLECMASIAPFDPPRDPIRDE